MDLPFIFFGLVVIVLLWRAPFLIADLVPRSAKERRRRAFHHFIMLAVDIAGD